MNTKKGLPRKLLRIAAFTMAFILVLGSMIVFGETVSHDGVNHVICEHCGGCTTAGCDYTDGVCPGCHVHGDDDTCEICGGCSYGAHCYSTGAVPCNLEDCTHGDEDHIFDEDTCICKACGKSACEGGCFEDTDDDGVYEERNSEACEGGCVLHSQVCPMCGGCTGGDKCYTSVGVPCTVDDCAGSCHFHDAADTCETCGGCLCDDIGHCYKLNTINNSALECEPCRCGTELGEFAAMKADGSLGKTLYVSEVSDMVEEQGSYVVRLVERVVLTDADGSTICSLSEAIADGATFSFTASMTPPNSTYGSTITLYHYTDSAHPGPMFNVDYRCVDGASAGQSIPVNIDLTVVYDGQTVSKSFTYTISVISNRNIVSLTPLTDPDIELLEGDTKTVAYRVVLSDNYTDGVNVSVASQNTSVATATASVVGESAPTVSVLITGIKSGTTTIELTVTDKADPVVDTQTATIRVDVKSDEELEEPKDPTSGTDVRPSDSDVPVLSVTVPYASVKVGAKVVITAKGWHNGSTFANASICYVPVSWKVNPEGTWEVSSSLTEADLTKTAEVTGLKEGSYTPTVTFARMVRGDDGAWTASGTPLATSTTLKVITSGNTGPGGNPDTGDSTQKNYAAIRRAGNIMLMAGLAIIAVLTAEQITHVLRERKRHTGTVRR